MASFMNIWPYALDIVLGFGPHITVINHDETTKGGAAAGGSGFLTVGGGGDQGAKGGAAGTAAAVGSGAAAVSGRNIITGAPSPSQLSRQGSSVESHASSVPIHFHTAECSKPSGFGVHVGSSPVDLFHGLMAMGLRCPHTSPVHVSTRALCRCATHKRSLAGSLDAQSAGEPRASASAGASQSPAR